MADQAFINSLAAAFAKEFAGSSDPTLNKKIKDIRDEVAKAIGSINPGQLSTAFSGNIDISSLLTPSVSNEGYKKNIRLRQDYDRLTKALLNRVNTYVARTSKLLTGTIEIGGTVREILGGNKKLGLFTSIKYNSVARKLLNGIGNYVDKFSKAGNIATGKLRFESAVANILNVDSSYSFWTKHRYNHLTRKLLWQIGDYVDKKGTKLFTGKVEAADAITSLLAVDKNWSFWTRRSYNKLTRKLLNVIDTFVTNNASNLIKGKLKVEDIIPSLLGGDVQSSWLTRRKFNTVRRNLLNKINDYVENGLQFDTTPIDALGLLDIHAGSLGDRKMLHDTKIKLHESFFNVTDKFITKSLSFVTPPQDIMNLLNIHATGFIDRAGIKQGFKQSVKAFFDRLKDHITNAKIKFKSEFKFDPLELVTISDTDKANLQRRYLTAVERYMQRIVQKLEKGVINLQALELRDNLGEDIANTIADKIKKGTITIGSINLQQPVGATVPQILPPTFGTEEKIFEDRVTKTMIVDSNSRAIDFEKIFCGCIGKLGNKFDKMIESFKMGVSSNTGGEDNGSSGIAQIIAAIAGSTLVAGAKEKISKLAKTAKEKVGNVAKAIKQKAGSMYNTAKSGLSWVGSKIGGALSSVGRGFTKAKDVVMNSLSSAKKALFSRLSSFSGGAKGYLKYVFKIPVINTIFTAFFASAEIQQIIANTQLTAAQKEQAIGVVVIKSLGTLLGGAAGAALLTAIPGGTILGGVLGSVAGSYIAEWIGNNIDARALGRLIIDIFGLSLGVTKETESAVDQRLGQAAEISPAGSTTSSAVSPISSAQVPRISNDYSPATASSSKTAISAIRSTKASDPIKQLNNTVQNLNKSIVSNNQSSIGTPAVPRGRAGNTGASKAFNGGGFREPAYNVRISAWSRLRPGSIMS